jgi:murein DD-endopeptidase MepM/ murein hydrolase activator NlpD
VVHPLNGDGFFQGVWSADFARFVFLAIALNAAGYQVIAVENEQQRVLFSGETSPDRGYLVPVGWATNGSLILLEHARVIEGHIETWFTGYAYLQTVLADPYSYIAEIGVPIALSGDTGLGGAHLHFEVRSPQQPIGTNWIDPWDTRYST